jgi:carbon storage regulator CsrA
VSSDRGQPQLNRRKSFLVGGLQSLLGRGAVFWHSRCSTASSFSPGASILTAEREHRMESIKHTSSVPYGEMEIAMLVLTRKLDEAVRIGEDIKITVIRVKGNTVRLGIEAPRSVRVVRDELDKHTSPPAGAGSDAPAAAAATPAAQSAMAVAPVIGTFIPEGAPLLKVYGEKPQKLLDYIKILGERSMEKDILIGFRQLSDISIRANSPGVNDPASSVQVIDQMHDLLKRLIKIKMGDFIAKDSEGKGRLLIRLPTWEDVLHVAVDETRLYGAGSLQVVRRLSSMLEVLLRDARDPQTMPRATAR